MNERPEGWRPVEWPAQAPTCCRLIRRQAESPRRPNYFQFNWNNSPSSRPNKWPELYSADKSRHGNKWPPEIRLKCEEE